MIEERTRKSASRTFLSAGPRELRRFGLVMAGALGAIALWGWYGERGEMACWSGGIGALFFLAGVLFPSALRLVYRAWMHAARMLGWINTHLLLGLVFYTLFTLIGGIMRLVRHDPLDRTLEPERRSYWLRRSRTALPRDHYERQF